MSQLINAIRELRSHLGESQQAFAQRVGISIRAIANYEKDREPSGHNLIALREIARSAQREDLADVFQQAWVAEVKSSPGFPQSLAESDVVLALLLTLRNNPERAKPILKSLARSMDELAKSGISIAGMSAGQLAIVAFNISLMTDPSLIEQAVDRIVAEQIKERKETK